MEIVLNNKTMETIISTEEYNNLKKRHEDGLRDNNYSKMIFIGSVDHVKMKEYEQQFCKHENTVEKQGGQIIECLICKKVMK